MPLQKTKYNPLLLAVTVKGRMLGGNIFYPKEKDNQPNKKYWSLVLDLGTEPNAAIEEMLNKTLHYAYPNGVPQFFEKWGMRYGEDPEFKHSYQRYFIHAKTGIHPNVLKRNSSGYLERVREEEDLFYSGAIVAASVSPALYERERKRGITLTLNGVMFVAHGEPINYMDVNSMFDGYKSSMDPIQNLNQTGDNRGSKTSMSPSMEFQRPVDSGAGNRQVIRAEPSGHPYTTDEKMNFIDDDIPF